VTVNEERRSSSFKKAFIYLRREYLRFRDEVCEATFAKHFGLLFKLHSNNSFLQIRSALPFLLFTANSDSAIIFHAPSSLLARRNCYTSTSSFHRKIHPERFIMLWNNASNCVVPYPGAPFEIIVRLIARSPRFSSARYARMRLRLRTRRTLRESLSFLRHAILHARHRTLLISISKLGYRFSHDSATPRVLKAGMSGAMQFSVSASSGAHVRSWIYQTILIRTRIRSHRVQIMIMIMINYRCK